MPDNRKKDTDASNDPILDEPTPADPKATIVDEPTDEPIVTPDVTENADSDTEPDTTVDDDTENKEPVAPKPAQGETEEEKLQRYKAQQSEAQIQKARNDALLAKIEESNNIPEPTQDDLNAQAIKMGANWEDLTAFEQAQTKISWKSEQRDRLLGEAVKTTKDIDEWANKVDTFIDGTTDKPEFIKLSGHETEFRRYSMQESHRGTPIETLLAAFLFNLPAPVKKRGSLFPIGGGGEKNETPGVITDAETSANLRLTNPKEYRRLLKSGKIKIEA